MKCDERESHCHWNHRSSFLAIVILGRCIVITVRFVIGKIRVKLAKVRKDFFHAASLFSNALSLRKNGSGKKQNCIGIGYRWLALRETDNRYLGPIFVWRSRERFWRTQISTKFPEASPLNRLPDCQHVKFYSFFFIFDNRHLRIVTKSAESSQAQRNASFAQVFHSQ